MGFGTSERCENSVNSQAPCLEGNFPNRAVKDENDGEQQSSTDG